MVAVVAAVEGLGGGALTEEQIEAFEREFLWDKTDSQWPIMTWLGGWPRRDDLHSEADFKPATAGVEGK